MKFYHHLENIDQECHNSYLIIGNFDGIHIGHQELIKKACQFARKDNKKIGLLTFEPHPRSLFRPNDPPFRITPLSLKKERLEQTQLDFVISQPFNWDFASQTPDDFINIVLSKHLKPSLIIVGYDFRFGQMRKGDYKDFEKAGFCVKLIDKISYKDDEAYSSSHIRNLLRYGKIDQANDLLGWEWEMRGCVFKGDQRGRELGYPTANIRLTQTIHPAYGIYATYVQIEGEDIWRPAATNIGIRPMFEVQTGQIEAHLLDFDGDLYDKVLRVKPVAFLRGEAKFESLDALIAQMDKDCAKAREILN